MIHYQIELQSSQYQYCMYQIQCAQTQKKKSKNLVQFIKLNQTPEIQTFWIYFVQTDIKAH